MTLTEQKGRMTPGGANRPRFGEAFFNRGETGGQCCDSQPPRRRLRSFQTCLSRRGGIGRRPIGTRPSIRSISSRGMGGLQRLRLRLRLRLRAYKPTVDPGAVAVVGHAQSPDLHRQPNGAPPCPIGWPPVKPPAPTLRIVRSWQGTAVALSLRRCERNSGSYPRFWRPV